VPCKPLFPNPFPPAGVLASVQAFVMEAAYDGKRFKTSFSRQDQQELLCKALASAIWQASCGSGAVLVGSSESKTSGLSYEALCRSAVVSQVERCANRSRS